MVTSEKFWTLCSILKAVNGTKDSESKCLKWKQANSGHASCRQGQIMSRLQVKLMFTGVWRQGCQHFNFVLCYFSGLGSSFTIHRKIQNGAHSRIKTCFSNGVLTGISTQEVHQDPRVCWSVTGFGMQLQRRWYSLQQQAVPCWGRGLRTVLGRAI